MICKRCGNKDPRYFYYGSKGYYCRKCVSFKRMLLEDDLNTFDYNVSQDSYEHNFDYPLTVYQQEISDKCAFNIQFKDVLLKAVCGAGKTEIVVESISNYLKRGLKVCYAIARREVVIDLYQRFKTIFNNADVAALYGGHHEKTYGDLIICTTHQLFRYYQIFDLLILDEVDAFPLSGNKELMHIALNSCRGHIIFSTATTNDFLNNILKERDYVELNLFVRPSLKPLIVPSVKYNFRIILIFELYIYLKKMKNQCIIFVSSKQLCLLLYRLFKKLINCTYVYSDLEDRDKNIMDFKDKKYQFIFATTVLERGITIKDVFVVVLIFNKQVFDKSSLVQMLGRVGRNFNNPYGEAYIFSSVFDKEIALAIDDIKEANRKYELSVL